MTTTILAPIDLADPVTTKKVLRAAVEQTTAAEGGALTAMTVAPDIVSGVDFRYAIRGATGGSADFDMKKIVADYLKKLNEIVSDQTPDGMKVKTIARHGTIYEQVLNVADEIGADQIVIGARSPGLEEFLLGSNTERIVRHAKCSVNIVRS